MTATKHDVPAASSSGDGRRATPFEARLRDLMGRVADGSVPPDAATEALRDLPFADLGFAKVDHHRELRQGTCEVVYAAGKTVRQVEGIVAQLLEGNTGPVLVSRASPEHRGAVRAIAAQAGLAIDDRPRSNTIAILRNPPAPAGSVLVVTAGTSDLPVAEEAALTASLFGARVEVVADIGVAGIHRVALIADSLREADAVIVVAGMEGALASVIGGLAACPVIACPTSVGYGASFGGLAALLAMLSSCAPGVVCVNVDDGVGAGYAAGLIARQASTRGTEGSRPE